MVGCLSLLEDWKPVKPAHHHHRLRHRLRRQRRSVMVVTIVTAPLT